MRSVSLEMMSSLPVMMQCTRDLRAQPVHTSRVVKHVILHGLVQFDLEVILYYIYIDAGNAQPFFNVLVLSFLDLITSSLCGLPVSRFINEKVT